MLNEAILYPFNGDFDIGDSLKRTIIFAAAYFTTLLVVPGFTVFGWLMEVLYAAYEGRETPEFDEFLDLTVLGVQGSLVSLGYVVVLYLSWVAITYSARVLTAPAMVLLGILALLLIPPALIEFQKKLDDGFVTAAIAAYDVRNILSKSGTSPYITAVLLTIIVGLVYAVLGVAVSITIVGILLVPGLLIARTASYCYCYGVGYRKAEESI